MRGFYSDGALSQAGRLQDEGGSYLKLFRDRNRAFGSHGIVGIIETAAAEMRHRFPDGERLQIGDVSGERGGLISRHTSHQNGLDADIVYFRVNRAEQDLGAVDGFSELFVSRGKVTSNFDTARVWELVKMFRATRRVGRIFVDPAVKLALCQRAEALGERVREKETLRRLRPLTGHADHLHLRLTCPVTSTACQAQVAPPEGDGCGDGSDLPLEVDDEDAGC